LRKEEKKKGQARPAHRDEKTNWHKNTRPIKEDVARTHPKKLSVPGRAKWNIDY